MYLPESDSAAKDLAILYVDMRSENICQEISCIRCCFSSRGASPCSSQLLVCPHISVFYPNTSQHPVKRTTYSEGLCLTKVRDFMVSPELMLNIVWIFHVCPALLENDKGEKKKKKRRRRKLFSKIKANSQLTFDL